MAAYNVYYFVIKPTRVPEHQGTTGESAELSPDSEDVETVRNEVLGLFETNLRDLIQPCVQHIPSGSKNFQVAIHRIPAASPGVPDFSSLSIGMRDPIIYLCTSRASDNPSDPQDRRPSLVFLNAMHGVYDEMSDDLYNHTHNAIINDPQTIGGKATNFSDMFPAIAEVFSDTAVAFDATNWREIQARTLAKIAFHEIAHNKCECENRATNARWSAAIPPPNSIHEQSGVSICAGSVGHATSLSDGDKQLFGAHMLCPIKHYQLDQPVADQFFSNGSSIQLQPAASGGGGADEPDDSDDTHDPIDISDSDDPLAGI